MITLDVVEPVAQHRHGEQDRQQEVGDEQRAAPTSPGLLAAVGRCTTSRKTSPSAIRAAARRDQAQLLPLLAAGCGAAARSIETTEASRPTLISRKPTVSIDARTGPGRRRCASRSNVGRVD